MKGGGGDIMSSYHLYSAILGLKLLTLSALSSIDPSCFPEKVTRASVADLKHLTPFWLIAGLYISTDPDENMAVYLLRAFVIARLILAFSYVQKVPRMLTQCAMWVSFGVTGYMGAWVVYYYRNAI